MDDIRLEQARHQLAGLCNQLTQIAARLRDQGEPQAATAATLDGICSDLAALGTTALATPLDRRIEGESAARAASEVESGEFDMQG